MINNKITTFCFSLVVVILIMHLVFAETLISDAEVEYDSKILEEFNNPIIYSLAMIRVI